MALKKADDLHEDNVHRLRVRIKKLRALLGFLGLLPHSNAGRKRLLKQLKPLFKAAGQIRTHQLNYRLTQGQRSAVMVKFRKELKQDKKEAEKDLLRELDRFDREKFKHLHHKVRDTYKKTSSKKVRRHIAKHTSRLFARVRATMYDIRHDDALHDIRKKLKAVKAVQKLSARLYPTAPVPAHVKKLPALEKKIGAWHDSIVLVEHLERFVKKLRDPKQAEKANLLVLKLKEENERHKLQIAQRLKKDLA